MDQAERADPRGLVREGQADGVDPWGPSPVRRPELADHCAPIHGAETCVSNLGGLSKEDDPDPRMAIVWAVPWGLNRGGRIEGAEPWVLDHRG